MTAALASKSESRGEIQDRYCHGLTGCSARIRRIEVAEMGPASPLGGQFRPGPPRQRHPGGGGQLAGQRDHCGPLRRADLPRPPGSGQVFESFQSASGEPAPPPAGSIDADAQVRGDAGVIPAPGGGQHDLSPQPVPVRGLGAADAHLQGRAPGGGQRDRHGVAGGHGGSRGRITQLSSVSGHVILASAHAARRHNEAHACHPGVHPQLDHLAAAGPRREELAAAEESPGQVPRPICLHHQRPARRPGHPAVPAPLRRLRALLRVRDLLRRP